MNHKKIALKDITREMFVEYESIRISGKCNMFAVACFDPEMSAVLQNYDALVKIFPGVRKGDN